MRDHYVATNERDFERAISHYAEDVELVVPSPHIRSGTFRGRDEVGRYFGEFFATFEKDARFEIKEVIDVNDTTVVLVAVYHARGRASGVRIAGEVVWLYRLSKGKIAGVRWYDSRSAALNAAGLV